MPNSMTGLEQEFDSFTGAPGLYLAMVKDVREYGPYPLDPDRLAS